MPATPPHDGPCVNAGDCCSWMCDYCENRRKEIPQDERRFRCVGFGEIGAANLFAFVPHPGQKPWQDLEINEQTIGTAQGCGNGAGKPERIIRTA